MPVVEKIDDMLLRLEEYETLINMVHDTSKDVVGSKNVESPLSKLAANCKSDLDKLCTQINVIENTMAVIRAEVNKTETAVLEAEMDLGAKKDNKLVSFLKDYRLV